MMHDGADTINADPGICGLAVPKPPTQAFDLLDDHRFRLRRRRTARSMPSCLWPLSAEPARLPPVSGWGGWPASEPSVKFSLPRLRGAGAPFASLPGVV